eukprot:15142-Heterococcus_DN1.PRE.1
MDALAASYIPSTTAAATTAAVGRAYSPTLCTRSYFPDSPTAASSSTHNGGSSSSAVQQQQQQQQQRCACAYAVPVWAASSVVGVIQVFELGGSGSVSSDSDVACTIAAAIGGALRRLEAVSEAAAVHADSSVQAAAERHDSYAPQQQQQQQQQQQRQQHEQHDYSDHRQQGLQHELQLVTSELHRARYTYYYIYSSVIGQNFRFKLTLAVLVLLRNGAVKNRSRLHEVEDSRSQDAARILKAEKRVERAKAEVHRLVKEVAAAHAELKMRALASDDGGESRRLAGQLAAAWAERDAIAQQSVAAEGCTSSCCRQLSYCNMVLPCATCCILTSVYGLYDSCDVFACMVGMPLLLRHEYKTAHHRLQCSEGCARAAARVQTLPYPAQEPQ